jgi:hypothetical protein
MKNGNKKSMNSKIGFFSLLLSMFLAKSKNEKQSEKMARHYSFMGGGNGEFHPTKHTVKNYATQKREATKRRNIKKHNN